MLCNICKKNEATVHLTEVINEEMNELHICEKCAQEKGVKMQQHFGIADLLSGLVDLPVDVVARKSHISIKCPGCGMSYENFKKLGRFGCARCYDAFRRALYPLFKKIHGSSYHMGHKSKKNTVAQPVRINKPARPVTDKDKVKNLKKRLTEAIKNEEFEQAAVLRDQIKAFYGSSKDRDEIR
jgi:protein arginine kinase activator